MGVKINDLGKKYIPLSLGAVCWAQSLWRHSGHHHSQAGSQRLRYLVHEVTFYMKYEGKLSHAGYERGRQHSYKYIV